MTDTTPPAQRDRMLAFYDGVSHWLASAVEAVAPDPAAVLARGRDAFEGMLGELPYVDRPDHSMAGSMFSCAAMLALFEVMRADGLDAHAWGRAIHDLPAPVMPEDEAGEERLRVDAEGSQGDAAPNEFVFEMLAQEGGSERGMNVTSCAICHLFARHDAMELVPYMCSFDDVMSDANHQGLRRTGTIALGATHCDFRFDAGGEPLRLVEQYPDRIRLRERS